jgi:hypothetical protein
MTTDWGEYLILLRSEVLAIRRLRVDILPVTVCGLLCSLLPATDNLSQLRDALACRVRARLQPEWLASGELAEVCAALDGLHAHSPDAITGSDIAALVQRLLQAETAVGGPYRDADGSLQVVTNYFVAQCLEWIAEPLTNVTDFLAASTQHFENLPVTSAEKTLLAALEPETNHGLPLHVRHLRSHASLLLGALRTQIATPDLATVHAGKHGGPAPRSDSANRASSS